MPKWWNTAPSQKLRGNAHTRNSTGSTGSPVSRPDTGSSSIKLEPILPHAANSDGCDVPSLRHAAAVLCVAGITDVEIFVNALGAEEREACTILCHLVDKKLTEVDDDLVASVLKKGYGRSRMINKSNVSLAPISSTASGSTARPEYKKIGTTGTTECSEELGEPASPNSVRGILAEEALAHVVSQVLQGVDNQLSATTQSLMQALADVQGGLQTKMTELQGHLMGSSTCVSSRSSSKPDGVRPPRFSPSVSDNEASPLEARKDVKIDPPKRKSCMKKRPSMVSVSGNVDRSSPDNEAGYSQSTLRRSTVDGTSTDLASRRHTRATVIGGALKLCPVEHHNEDPTKHYAVAGFKLGAGTFGTTRVGRHKETGIERAIKQVPKVMHSEQVDIWREINMLMDVDHPHIVRLFATYEDDKNLYLVMELCSGGELFDAIVESQGLSEKFAARMMRQMLSAIGYLHARKICHRDLKPENFLLLRKIDDEEKHQVKLIDFGTAKCFGNGQELTTKVFTVHYVAPEVLTRNMKPYTELCDVWSLGVILYLLLCGRPPFEGQDDMEIMKKIKKGKYTLTPSNVWDHISADAIEFMGGMLEVQVSNRRTAQNGLQHRWVVELAPDASGTAFANKSVVGGLRSFMAQNKLKKCALQVIAQNISDDHLDFLKSAFMGIDADCSGSLQANEIEDAIRGLELESEAADDILQVLHDMAAEGNGAVNYTQFLGATIDRKQYMQEKELRRVFDCFDVDGDGQISKEELKAVLLGPAVGDVNLQPKLEAIAQVSTLSTLSMANVGVDELDDILKGADKDGDGNIDFQEFFDMMNQPS